MKRIYHYSLALMSTLLVTALTSNAQADTYQHVENMARTVMRKSRALAAAVRHYEHTSEYSHLIDDTQRMRATAEHIAHWADHRGELNDLVRDIRELDRVYRHAERLFNRIEAAAARGYGHVHGNTAYVRRLLNDLQECIHHLEEDARILRAAAYGGYGHGGYRVPYEPPVVYPQPGCRSGLTIGNSGFRFRIGF